MNACGLVYSLRTTREAPGAGALREAQVAGAERIIAARAGGRENHEEKGLPPFVQNPAASIQAF